MDDALHLIRCAYGVEASGAPPPDAPEAGAPGHVEWSLLAQMRTVLDRWPVPAPSAPATDAVVAHAAEASAAVHLDALVASLPAAPAHRPSSAVIEAVEERAAAATLAAVRQAYDESAPAMPVAPVEAALLAQSRSLLERAPRAEGPSSEGVAAILARADEATLTRGASDDTVTAPPLAPLAAVYGIGASSAATDPVETALLAGARDALTLLPRLRPEAATVAAILAQAASAAPVAPIATPRETTRSAPRAADRAAVAGAAAPDRRLRTGVWTGSAALVGALLAALVLFPRAGTDTVDAGRADAGLTESSIAAAPLVADAEPVDPAPADAFSGETVPSEESLASTSAPSPAGIAPDARPALAAAPEGTRTAPAPVAARRPATLAPSAEALATTITPVAARTPAPSAGWGASDDLHTISLRLRTLRQGTPTQDWEAPAEAFGAPRAPITMSAMPGLHSVRAGAVTARARVRPDSTQTGD